MNQKHDYFQNHANFKQTSMIKAFRNAIAPEFLTCANGKLK